MATIGGDVQPRRCTPSMMIRCATSLKWVMTGFANTLETVRLSDPFRDLPPYLWSSMTEDRRLELTELLSMLAERSDNPFRQGYG